MLQSSSFTEACVVCEAPSDGPHFGVSACRACAAFFRRTVALGLDYSCRAGGGCTVNKAVRNMCRGCRYRKCLDEGMLITSVQQPRAKRKADAVRDAVFAAPHSPPRGKRMLNQGVIAEQSHSVDRHSLCSDSECCGGGAGPPQRSALQPVGQQIGQNFGLPSGSQGGGEMKILPRMRDGYLHYLSIRKATSSMVEGQKRTLFGGGESLRLSSYMSCKRVRSAESPLVSDIVNQYFHPFRELPKGEKVLLFRHFCCFGYLNHADCAYQTYNTFGGVEGDDRLLMCDGGFVRLSQLDQFYEGASETRSPKEAAEWKEVEKEKKESRGGASALSDLFRPALSSLLSSIIPHMKRMMIDEIEYIALLGLFLWNDEVTGLQPFTYSVIERTQQDIFHDLHVHFTSMSLSGPAITQRIGQLMMLLPKLTSSISLLHENADLAELFDIVQPDTCCKKEGGEAGAGCSCAGGVPGECRCGQGMQ